MCHCIFDVIISFFDNYSEPLSDFFITMSGYSISSLRAILSVWLHLFCLCLALSNISDLILLRNVSKVPLSDNLSGFGLRVCYSVKAFLVLFLICFWFSIRILFSFCA